MMSKNNGCVRLFSERIHFRPPFSNVFLVASLEGELSAERLEAARRKAAIRHPLLTASIQMDEEGDAWFQLREGDASPDLTVIPKKGEGHWQEVFLEEEKRPFSLSRGPLARFVLLQDRGGCSELMMIWHHTLCDGISASYLLRDILRYLAAPDREAVPLPVNIIKGEEDLPVPPLKGISALIARSLNRAWKKEKTVFSEAQYQKMAADYWRSCETVILTRTLPAESVTGLRERCHSEGVTVNSAVLTAFSEARRALQGDGPAHLYKTGVAVNIREGLKKNPGQCIGNFAGGLSLVYRYNTAGTFWENTRKLHKIVARSLSSQRKVYLFLQFVMSLEPTLMDAVYFHLYDNGYHNKTAARLAGILGLGAKRQGLGVTNIGRLDLSENCGGCRLKQVTLIPPHWPQSENICGVATAAGVMNLALLHRRQHNRSDEVMEQVMDRVAGLLQNAASQN